MLYIFDVVGTPYIKLGYTSQCPWLRVREGFWKLVHPVECCGCLGYEDLELLVLTPGSLLDEHAIKLIVPPRQGEFWGREQLESSSWL